ncbi:MAG TPA: transaldolase [Gemmatimonadaceae bacterium]|jgi:transaldolase|nr:transaldolase [Gemmatimonadaceae bacterium]
MSPAADRLQRLHDAGVSIWLDFIERTILRNGELERRIREDALTGMTSNPTIFEKALAEGSAYDDQIRSAPGDVTAMELFELIATTDVRDACDTFRGVYDKERGTDGFVSIEVSPAAAHDLLGTVSEATRLWSTVDRPNVMVKVPGTIEGAEATRRLIASGININITLLFSLEAYRRVIEAYIAGLEERVAAGKDIRSLSSVASFFVSRVDTEVDKRLDALVNKSPDSKRLDALRGKAAIANAKLAYGIFQKEFSSPRWKRLEEKGAAVQRVLWASTSTKNPAYRDVMYVEQLIGPHTVNTMPPATIDAFRDHGDVKRTVDQDIPAAERVIADLSQLGISMDDVTNKLLVDGLASFQKSFDTLIAGLAKKTKALGRDLVASR